MLSDLSKKNEMITCSTTSIHYDIVFQVLKITKMRSDLPSFHARFVADDMTHQYCKTYNSILKKNNM